MVGTCGECECKVAEDNDFLCYDCRIKADHDLTEHVTIIYLGDMYRGNILRCEIAEWRDPDRRRDRGMCLKVPDEFSHNTFIWTKEKWFKCECGELAISHWSDDVEECALCAGAQIFPWAKRIV